MKRVTLLRNLSYGFILAAVCCFALSSCGTIASALTKGKRPSFIVNTPKDIVVKLDGKPLDIELELFASDEYVGTGSSLNYYTSAVKLPYKKKITLEFSSASLGKTGTLELNPKASGAIFWGNVIIAPIVGHIIDKVTKNSKVLKPKYIDVMKVLNNVPMKDWPSQGKLKRQQKRKIKKGN
jgi:hypothetical protein